MPKDIDVSMFERIKTIFDAPSRRGDADYSIEVSDVAKMGVLLVYREVLEHGYAGDGWSTDIPTYWMEEVLADMVHLYHPLRDALGGNDPFGVLQHFLMHPKVPREAFLDFLEASLRNRRAPNYDNGFIETVNRVLEEYGSAYLLTHYAYSKRVQDNGLEVNDITAYPRAYLKQESVVQKEAIEPALEIFSDPAYLSPAADFRTALGRHRTGDYDGCVTSCAAAVEGVIKVAAKRLGWRKVKGNGLGKLAQSFLGRSSLPDTLLRAFYVLADYRSAEGDAHGHASKSEPTEAVARFFVGWAATLIVLVQSEVG